MTLISCNRRDHHIINPKLHPHDIRRNELDLDNLACLTRREKSRKILPYNRWPDIIRKGRQRNLDIINVQGQVRLLGRYVVIIGDEDLYYEFVLPLWAKSDNLAEVELEIGGGGVVGDSKGVIGLKARLSDVERLILSVLGVGRDDVEDAPRAKDASFEVAVFDNGKHVLTG